MGGTGCGWFGSQSKADGFNNTVSVKAKGKRQKAKGQRQNSSKPDLWFPFCLLPLSAQAKLACPYSALSTDIGVIRTALSAGTSVPANAIRSDTPMAVANVAGSPGATPKSSELMPCAAR